MATTHTPRYTTPIPPPKPRPLEAYRLSKLSAAGFDRCVLFGSLLQARHRAGELLRLVLDEPDECNLALTYWPKLLPNLGQDESLNVAYQLLWHFEQAIRPKEAYKGLPQLPPRPEGEAFYVDVQWELIKQASGFLCRGEGLPEDICYHYRAAERHARQQGGVLPSPPRYWQGYFSSLRSLRSESLFAGLLQAFGRLSPPLQAGEGLLKRLPHLFADALEGWQLFFRHLQQR